MKGSASAWQSVHGLTVATTAEQVAAQEAVRAFARTANVIEDARDETGTAWHRVWSPLADLGVFGVAVPEDAGGAGGTLVLQPCWNRLATSSSRAPWSRRQSVRCCVVPMESRHHSLTRW
jgi:alkylation response protein AidB-like acyl-CoA dehydrogenase